jgi:LysR family transcriptional regulator, nitrogen assimilation regulatory protein
MNLRQLRYLVAIVDFGSLSKAAAQLNVAQPALSQQMAQLEGELRQQLLVRSSQGVQPTAAGMRLYRHARTILRQIEQAKQDVSGTSVDLTGNVAIGIPTSTSTILSLPLLKEVRKRYPGIRLQIFESLSGYLNELIINNRLDIAILFRGTTIKGVLVEPLLEEDLFLVSAPDEMVTPAGSTVAMPEIASIPLVLPSQQHSLRTLIDSAFARLGVELDVIADIDSLPTLRGAAQAGIAATILPQAALWSFNGRHPITVQLLTQPGIQRKLALCRPEGTPSTPAAEAVRTLLRELVATMIADGTWTGARRSTSMSEL